MRKLKCFLLTLFISATLSANPFAGSCSLVILDAGHGGNDPGAISGNVQEKNITLSVTKKVEALLDGKVATLLTREDDSYLSLQARCDAANSAYFDITGYPLFVSIHVNSATSTSASGFEVYVKQKEKRTKFISPSSSDNLVLKYSSYTNTQLNSYADIVSRTLASKVEANVFQAFPQTRMRGIKEGDLWVLNATWMPAILIELGFISNETEKAKLVNESWQDDISKAIADAILSFT